MPTIKKIIVSGSNISQLTNDAGYALATNITGAFTEVSGGLAGRINLLETQGSTNAQTASFVLSDNVKFTVVVSGTSSFETLTAVSTSIAADIASLEATVGAGGLLSSSAQIAVEISGAFTEVSGGLANRIETIETQGSTNASTASYVSSDNVKFASDGGEQTATGVSSSIAGRVTTLEGSGTIQGVGQSDNVTFASVTTTADVTVGGNLYVNGTTTAINSDNLNIEDKFILLNSGSAGSPSYEGGIIVESGSVAGAGNAFYFDASDNRWALKNGLSAGNTAGVTAEAFMGIAIVDTLSNAQNSVHYKEGAIIVDNQDIYIVTV
jgi:hypothetical protein